MGIHGDLKTMPVAELLRWAGAERRTGTLEFERNSIRKSIVFRDGQVVACGSDDPATFLGQYLLSRGAISKAQLQEALREQEESGRNLGEILLDKGTISDEQRAEFVRAKTEETIFGVFDWDDASFRFDADVNANPHLVDLELQVDEIIRRGIERREHVSEANEMLEDPGIVLRRTGETLPPDLAEDPVATRIYELIDGEKTIAELLLFTHAPEYIARKLLVKLLRDGHVEIEEVVSLAFDSVPLFEDEFFATPVELPPLPTPAASPESTPPAAAVEPAVASPGPAQPAVASAQQNRAVASSGPSPATAEIEVEFPSPEAEAPTPSAEAAPNLRPDPALTEERVKSDIEVALGLMAGGKHEQALTLLRAIASVHPGDSSITKLISAAERNLQQDLTDDDLAPERVPVLVKPLRQTLADGLSPEESFIVGLIDGSADVRGITWVSPVREVEVLKILKRLKERGLIVLTG
jgi:hypothetical protein